MSAQRSITTLAAIGAVAFTLAVLVYFPLDFWTGVHVFAAAMIPVSLGLFAYTSYEYPTEVNIGLAGIAGFLCVAHLIAAGRIFAFGIHGDPKITAVLCIANLAFGGGIVVVVGASARIIAANIERNDTGSEFSRLARELSQWANGADDAETKRALLALAEELRYFPRRIRQDGGLPEDVDARAAELNRLVSARAWADSRQKLAELRRSLEASRISIQSTYTKA